MARADLLAIILCVGGVLAAVAMMTVPMRYPRMGSDVVQMLFWGGMMGAVLCVAVGLGIASGVEVDVRKSLLLLGAELSAALAVALLMLAFHTPVVGHAEGAGRRLAPLTPTRRDPGDTRRGDRNP